MTTKNGSMHFGWLREMTLIEAGRVAAELLEPTDQSRLTLEFY